MSTWKTKVAVGLGSMGLAAGVLTAVSPEQRNLDQDRNKSNIEQGIGELSDADQANKDRFRDEGIDLGEANHQDSLRPGEHRPPHFRIRLP